MDSIRLGQINEVLNYDKNINAMVFNLEKKRTATFPDEEVLPYSQIAEEMQTNIQQGSNTLKVMLDSKIASVAQLNRAVGVDSGYSSAFADISAIQPVIQAYSQVVTPYSSPRLTQQTKDAILTQTRSLMDRLGRLDGGLTRFLGEAHQGEIVLAAVTALAVK